MIPWKGSFVFLVREETRANHCQSSLFFIKISGKNCKKKDSHLAANSLCTLVATGEDTPLQFIFSSEHSSRSRWFHSAQFSVLWRHSRWINSSLFSGIILLESSSQFSVLWSLILSLIFLEACGWFLVGSSEHCSIVGGKRIKINSPFK